MVHCSSVLRLLLMCGLACEALGQLSNMASPRVTVADGKLRGKYVLSRESKKVRAFLGVPYAKPPVDDLRFKSPEPPVPWDQERLAMDHPKPCVQPHKRHGDPVGREDCLYLNVYTPDNVPKRETPHPRTVMSNKVDDTMSNEIPANIPIVAAPALNSTKAKNPLPPADCPLLPVMVFFHGGALEQGHSEPFTHEYLMDGEVILVIVQYRLGLLGFLSTGDEALPGNLGFKDQRLALKWVQENIEHFGGCPDRVTIFGDGVGGVSVHYHMLFSPSKNATFRAGISMSGTALSPWAFRPPSEVAHQVERLASLSDCPKESAEFVECLRQKPAEEFVVLLQKYKNETLGGCGDWALAMPALGGVLEDSNSEDAFITANPWDKKVSLPWMVGVTSKEMLYEFTPQLVDRKNRLFKDLDKCFNSSLPKVLGFNHSNATEAGLVAGVRSFYFNGNPINREVFADLVDAVSDGSVVYPAFEAVRRAGRRTTWLYHFNFIGTNTYGATSLDGRIAPGRGDDLFFVFPRPLGKSIPRKNKEPDTVMSRKMVKLWTNFAKNLDPTPTEVDGLKWLAIAPSTTFLNIGQEKMTIERPFHAFRMNFWSMQSFPHRDDKYEDVFKKPPPEVEVLPPLKEEVTAPEVTVPEVTDSKVTAPVVTVPEVTGSKVTAPKVTVPEVTDSKVTAPVVRVPEVTGSKVTASKVMTFQITSE